ncbi:MAG: FHA domain-containing protein [Myxococcota bacterium]
MPKLMFSDPRTMQEREVELDPQRLEVTLGRNKQNDVAIKHSSVSRSHARIVFQSGAFVLLDLKSSNGTFVNGQRVERARLAHGDEIRAGDVALRFEDQDSVPTNPFGSESLSPAERAQPDVPFNTGGSELDASVNVAGAFAERLEAHYDEDEGAAIEDPKVMETSVLRMDPFAHAGAAGWIKGSMGMRIATPTGVPALPPNAASAEFSQELVARISDLEAQVEALRQERDVLLQQVQAFRQQRDLIHASAERIAEELEGVRAITGAALDEDDD